MAEPPITLHAIHDDGPGNLTPTRIVIHATCPNIGYPKASAAGLARSTANYFTSKAAGGSAHYVVDPDDEQHSVADAHIAWHAPPNPHSIGIEICAEGGDYPRSYTRDQWLSPQVWPAVERAAARTAELCDRHGIPKVRLSVADLLAGRHGICGHVDVSNAWHQSAHSDPGPAFPWAEFMDAVTDGAHASSGTPKARHLEDDGMYIRYQVANGPMITAILSGSLLMGLGTPGELKSAQANIDAGSPCQWVDKPTWDALDAASHRVHDNPRPVVISPAKP